MAISARDSLLTASAISEAWRLRVVVFICGASFMALEMAGVRILEPHFGSTIYIWGAIIGIFLTALSVGYWLGGKLADRHPNLGALGLVILAAAGLTFLVPLLADDLCRWLSGTEAKTMRIADHRLRAVVASLLLYAAPSALLGMVSPFALRLAARSLSGMGSVAGSLYALSTAGSIIGTFLVSFVLVEVMGSRHIIVSVGVALMAMGCLCLLPRWRGAGQAAIAAVSVFFLGLGWGGLQRSRAAEERNALRYLGGTQGKVLRLAESPYHYISIIESDYNFVERETLPPGKRARYMLFNNQIESGVVLDEAAPSNPIQSACGYTRLLHLGVIFTGKAPNRVLIIGCGGGVGPQEFIQDYGKAVKQLDVVDIDPQVFVLAHEFFRYPLSHPVIRSHSEDGRGFVARSRETWDYIVLDAYTSGGRIPRHLITREFFTLIRQRLAAEGVLLANIISSISGPQARLFRAVYRTMSEVFGAEALYAFPRSRLGRSGENIILVATMAVKPRLDYTAIQARYLALKGNLLKQKGLEDVVRLAMTTAPEGVDEAPLLTDDFCPTDSMVYE